MVKSLFITATGTDVGKTYVSALIVKKMREFGLNCGYFKPVLSGAIKSDDGSLIPGDCKHVVDIAHLDRNPADYLSYCFEEAVSPHLASKRIGVEILESKIENDYSLISANYDYMVIEGAGGITCPLRHSFNKSDMFLLSDLVKCMNKDLLLIADGGLGTINSVVTSVEYIEKCGLSIRGIILNNFDKNNFMHRDNLYMVEKITGLNVVATVAKGEKDLQIDKKTLEVLFKED